MRLTADQPSNSNAQTVTDMFELGWFGQGADFWHWIETEAALPYVMACAAMRHAPHPGELFDAFADDPVMSAIADPDHLVALAVLTDAQYGDGSAIDSIR